MNVSLPFCCATPLIFGSVWVLALLLKIYLDSSPYAKTSKVEPPLGFYIQITMACAAAAMTYSGYVHYGLFFYQLLSAQINLMFGSDKTGSKIVESQFNSPNGNIKSLSVNLSAFRKPHIFKISILFQ